MFECVFASFLILEILLRMHLLECRTFWRGDDKWWNWCLGSQVLFSWLRHAYLIIAESHVLLHFLQVRCALVYHWHHRCLLADIADQND